MAIDTTSTPSAYGRWISQSSADANLGIFTAAQMNELTRHGVCRHAEPGEVVAAAGKPASHVQIVRSGELELMTRLPTGRATMALVRAGGVIADIPMILDVPMPFDAVASRDTELILLTQDQWMELLTSSSAICLRWMGAIARRLDDDRRRLVVLMTRPLESRLAYVLLEAAESEPDGSLHVRLSHTTLGHLIGARRQSVTRSLGELRDRGLIATRYGVVHILDRDGLNAVAGEDPLTA
jgi:CRP-like cAMP-binding protein